jgi:hypothetical protein
MNPTYVTPYHDDVAVYSTCHIYVYMCMPRVNP